MREAQWILNNSDNEQSFQVLFVQDEDIWASQFVKMKFSVLFVLCQGLVLPYGRRFHDLFLNMYRMFKLTFTRILLNSENPLLSPPLVSIAQSLACVPGGLANCRRFFPPGLTFEWSFSISPCENLDRSETRTRGEKLPAINPSAFSKPPFAHGRRNIVPDRLIKCQKNPPSVKFYYSWKAPTKWFQKTWKLLAVAWIFWGKSQGIWQKLHISVFSYRRNVLCISNHTLSDEIIIIKEAEGWELTATSRWRLQDVSAGDVLREQSISQRAEMTF